MLDWKESMMNDLTIDDFRPLPGDEECIGYETVLEFDEQRNPIGVHYDPIFVLVEEENHD
jgi:hypothetical protein